ncbi:hypothetical protein ACFQU7_15930 [Pseudoroseomonas wenyumeiae]
MRQADGSWLVAPGDLAGLSLRAPADFAGTLDLTLRATAREVTGDIASSETSFAVRVAPVVDGAVLAGLAAGSEDQWITLEVTFGTSPDASEAWDARVLIHGMPAGAVLSQGKDLGGGSWAVERAALAAGQVAILPPADSDAPITLRLEAVMRDAEGGGAERSIEAPLLVQVSGVADAPMVMAASVSGHEDGSIILDLSSALADLDGSETISVSILGLPAGAMLSTGARQADGSWRVAPGDLAGLSLRPPADFAGVLDLTLRATAREANGDAASSEAAFSVTVAPVADAAIIAASGEGEEDRWIPLRGSLALRDADGSERFGETLVVRGMPPGALLSHGREVEAESGKCRWRPSNPANWRCCRRPIAMPTCAWSSPSPRSTKPAACRTGGRARPRWMWWCARLPMRPSSPWPMPRGRRIRRCGWPGSAARCGMPMVRKA